MIVEFEGRLSTKVRKQERIDKVEKKNFRRRKLPGKYIANILYR